MASRPAHVPTLALLALFALAALAFVSADAGASIDFEGSPTNISESDKGAQSSVRMAAGPDDRLYAVWEDARLLSLQGKVSVLFATSMPNDRGRAWGGYEQMRASVVGAEQRAPAIAVGPGPDPVIHVVWQELSPSDDASGGPFWMVRYSRSVDLGRTWSEPQTISRPNNRNNTRPAVTALPDDTAYVAWEMEDHPGSSIVLALVHQDSRQWIREDFVKSTPSWEHNRHVSIGVTADWELHVTWAAVDVDAMLSILASQVFFMDAGLADRDSEFPSSIALADDPHIHTNTGPTLAITKRHGDWVTWVQEATVSSVDQAVTVLADRVVEGRAGTDIPVAMMSPAPDATPRAHASLGPDDNAQVAISGVGAPSPPIYTATCSEHGCFGEPNAVVGSEVTEGYNAMVISDSLGNVYVAWDDGDAVLCTQRRNSKPGMPELLLPDRYTHDTRPELVWAFSDRDAGASQSAFEIQYSMDPELIDPVHHQLVAGAPGRSNRYRVLDPLDEGMWYWRVLTRDQLGLWSEWSHKGEFLADRTAPEGTVLINDGDEFTHQRVVVLTLNATDNLIEVADEMYFQISSDPNFPNSTKHEWPPPNHQVNQELPEGEGVKVVFFRIFDESGLHHTAMDTIIFNETPYDIIHQPVTTAPLKKPLNISCEITRVTDVSTTLFYRRAGDEDYTEMEMVSNGTNFWAEIPKEDISLKGLQYYIRARSQRGTVTSPPTNPAEEPYEVEVYETTEEYRPPIYNPIVTFTGAVIIAVLLFLVWYYRLREKPD